MRLKGKVAIEVDLLTPYFSFLRIFEASDSHGST